MRRSNKAHPKACFFGTFLLLQALHGMYGEAGLRPFESFPPAYGFVSPLNLGS